MSLELIKTLRERTHLGMSDCKKALEATAFDLDKAIEFLQKKGLKKVDDLIIPMEGEVRAVEGLVYEINIQTDFGARSETFKNLVTKISDELENAYESTQDLNIYFAEYIKEASKILGEKITIRRLVRCETPLTFGLLKDYNHLGGKIAVSVSCETTGAEMNNRDDLHEFMENVAMQIAAMKPLSVERTNLSEELVAKKKALFEEEAASKPEIARLKIVEGRLNKWYSEVVLLDQESISEPKVTIRQQMAKFEGMRIINFVRLERGEV